jgi:hypothetical protein
MAGVWDGSMSSLRRASIVGLFSFFYLRMERQMRIFESCLLDFVKQQEQMHGYGKTNELKTNGCDEKILAHIVL